MKTRHILLVSAAVVLVLGAIGYARGHRAGPADRLSPDRIEATARRLVEAGPAAEGSPSKDRVQKLLEEELAKAGATVKVLPFRAEVPGHGTWELVNVVGSYHPEAKRRLVVGTHWDTRPWADEDADAAKRGAPIAGANDGVSGAAVILELARALDRNPPPADTGVDLVFFDGEEGPKDSDAYFLGSKHLAETWFETGVAVPTKGVILDMVGKKGLQIRREWSSDRLARGVNDRIFEVAKARHARVFVDEPGKKVSDDHLAFQGRNLPVALLIDLDYPQWHTSADTLDRLDPTAMDEVGEVVLDWIAAESARR